MTERGLPIVDGAPACPFVAFEDDRDGRGTAPDHRHRCYAEARPAPRALAHQEAYCLSSAFPVCPTFQDWARREAAAARAAAPEPRPVPREEAPASASLPPRDRQSRHAPAAEIPGPIPPRRNPHRDWAAPPPWSAGDTDDASLEAGREAGSFRWGAPLAAGEPARSPDPSRGLAGSPADRLAGPDPERLATPRLFRGAVPAEDDVDDADDLDEPDDPGSAPAGIAPRQPHVGRRPPVADPEELFGPAWERPRRYEAYPSLKTRVGLPSMGGIPRLGVAAIALVLAALVLFFVGPLLLGIGGKGPGPGAGTGASPTPGASATPNTSPSLTAAPAPTAQVYVVAKGDTTSRIAQRFGITVEQLMAANPQVKNPDKIKIGDQLTIPAPVTGSSGTVGSSDAVGASPSP